MDCVLYHSDHISRGLGNGTFVLHQTIRQLTLHSDDTANQEDTAAPRYHAVRWNVLFTALFARMAAPLASTIGDGQRREAEVYLRRKAGHRVPVCVRVSPLHDAVVYPTLLVI